MDDEGLKPVALGAVSQVIPDRTRRPSEPPAGARGLCAVCSQASGDLPTSPRSAPRLEHGAEPCCVLQQQRSTLVPGRLDGRCPVCPQAGSSCRSQSGTQARHHRSSSAVWREAGGSLDLQGRRGLNVTPPGTAAEEKGGLTRPQPSLTAPNPEKEITQRCTPEWGCSEGC